MSGRKKPSRSNPFVTAEVCQSRHEALSKQLEGFASQLRTVTNALVGPNLQGGLVKEVSDIKSKIQMASELRDWIRPVIIAVVSAAVTAGLMKFLHI